MKPNISISWLLSKGALALDFGRLATGYGMGVFSYVVSLCSLISNVTLAIVFGFSCYECFNILSNELPLMLNGREGTCFYS